MNNRKKNEADGLCFRGYFSTLVNRLFKILPMREDNEGSLAEYMDSLMVELIGFGSLSPEVGDNAAFVSILSTLKYLQDNIDVSVRVFRREVFRCISVCNYLREKYGGVQDER